MNPEHGTPCNQAVENKTNIEGLKGEGAAVWTAITELRKEVKEALAAALKRPGWAVTIIISALLALCTGLIVHGVFT